jgi:hypothetical protein
MITYRISEIGSCPKKISLSTSKADGKIPTWLQSSANEGKWHEKRIKDEMKKAGYTVKDVDICPICMENLHEERNGLHVEMTQSKDNKDEAYKLIGHLDGQVSHPEYTKGKTYGLECKSMSQFEYDRWIKGNFNEFPTYAWQVSVYSYALAEVPFIYVVKNRNIGGKDSRVIEKPLIVWKDIDDKMTALTSWINTTSEPFPAEYNADSIECRRCKFMTRCIPEPKIMLPVEKERLDAAVVDWRKGKELEGIAEELKSKAEEIFIEHCKATTENKWRYEGLSINYSESGFPRIYYPKENLLTVLSEEQLKAIGKLTEAKPSVRIIPLKDKENK